VNVHVVFSFAMFIACSLFNMFVQVNKAIEELKWQEW